MVAAAAGVAGGAGGRERKLKLCSSLYHVYSGGPEIFLILAPTNFFQKQNKVPWIGLVFLPGFLSIFSQRLCPLEFSSFAQLA